jgi:sugar lactone lactonase YvrE
MEQAHQELKLIWDGKAMLAEGPVWDHTNGQLVWVDIMGKCVHFFDPTKAVDRTITLDQRIGAAVPTIHGGLILALENGFHELDLETERLTKIIDPESDKPGNRFNDGKCDDAGRFWAGTMDMNEEHPNGSLYCLETNRTLRKAVEGIIVSNGMAWSPDNRTMYYIDSPTKRVLAYDFVLESGELSNPRIVVTIPDGEGFPDGMTVDTEGMLWIAQWDGWQVSRWDPHLGKRILSIPVPVARVSSCVFGGENFDELFITTARVGLNEKQLADQPSAGGIFSIKPGYKGRPSSFYGN